MSQRRLRRTSKEAGITMNNNDTGHMTRELQREIDELYAVQLHNLTKRFNGGTVGLDDISVGFRTGEFTVLLGLSGSGKSTLLRHINGLYTATEGTVRVFGQDLGCTRGRDLRELRRDIGVVFQNFNLVGPMSVLENVCTGRLGSLRGPRLSLIMYPRAVREEALAQLARVGLADHAHQRADTLSGGQQQRVAIARALMQKPRILVADEPVASLDPVSSLQVMNLLKQISVEDELTVCASLHQVHLAIDFADRIIGLRAGSMVLDRRTDSIDAEGVGHIYESVARAPEEQASAPAPAGQTGAVEQQ